MVVLFCDVKIGELFRGLRSETIKNRKTGETREVPSDGLYVKVSHYVSVDIAHGNKDAILSQKLPCRVLPKKVDATRLEAWRISHRGQPCA
jgi:hypothetical protein